MSSRVLYKVSFLYAGKIYELYARRVSSGQLWGFTEIADLVFDASDGSPISSFRHYMPSFVLVDKTGLVVVTSGDAGVFVWSHDILNNVT